MCTSVNVTNVWNDVLCRVHAHDHGRDHVRDHGPAHVPDHDRMIDNVLRSNYVSMALRCLRLRPQALVFFELLPSGWSYHHDSGRWHWVVLVHGFLSDHDN